jgi:PAS domain S-box-containing protein
LKKQLSPLTVRISLVIVLVVAVVGVMSTIFLNAHLARELETQFQERGETLGLLLARLVNEGIAEENLNLVNRASYLLAEPDVKELWVFNEYWDEIDSYAVAAGRPKIAAGAPRHQAARDFFREHPKADYYFSGEVAGASLYGFYARVLYQPYLDSPPLDAGFVALYLGADRIIEAGRRMFRLHLGVALLFCLITIMILVGLLHGLVVRPVRRLQREMELFGRDGRRPPDGPLRRDEIGGLARQFRAMAATIEERSRALAEKTVYLDALLKSSSYGIVAADQELRVNYINPVMEKMFNCRAMEVLGQKADELHARWGVDQPLLATLRDLVRRHTSHSFRLARPDGAGGLRTLEATIFAITGGLEPNRGFMLMVEDISDRLAVQARLAASEARNRAVIEALTDGLVIVNREGVINQWNDPIALLTGHPLQDLEGAFLPGILFAPEERQRFLAWFEAASTWPAPRTGGDLAEFTTRSQEGGEVPVEVSLSPCLIDHEWYGVLVVRDISQRKRYIRELERSNQELEQFAYVASHDLQEPLRVITGFVQLLEESYCPALDAEGREYMVFIIEAAARMKHLIHDLLVYSRLTTTGASPASVDLGVVLARVQDNLALLIAESRAEITCSPLPMVHGDQGQMIQLFQNLVANGIRYCLPAEPPRIHLVARRRGKEWVFSVADRGIGIEPRYFERIFKIFQRLHADEEYPGTGIGLAICRKVVEHHQGRIWVKSIPGRGSIFFFTLPAVELAKGESAHGTD